MARTRNLKPSFFTNDLLAECEPMARLLFAGLWTLADRDGRLEYRPRRIKGALFPYDNCEIELLVQQLATRGFVQVYRAGAVDVLAIPTFGEHQRCHPDERSEGLPPPQDGSEKCVFPERNAEPGNPAREPGNFPATCALYPSVLTPSVLTPHSSPPPSGTQKRSRSVATSDPIEWTAEAGWSGISDEHRQRWATAYPAADLPVELAKADEWLRANPTKAKRSRWGRFVTSWLSRCQDRGGTHRVNGTQAAPRAVVRTPRPDLGGQVMSDEEYGRERRRLARLAEYLAGKEQARRERMEEASLGETLSTRVSRLKEGQQ
jgi:hypothetical protein